jgi:putative hemolysin
MTLCVIGWGLISSIELALAGLPNHSSSSEATSHEREHWGLSQWAKAPLRIWLTLFSLEFIFMAMSGFWAYRLLGCLGSGVVAGTLCLGLGFICVALFALSPRFVAKKWAVSWARQSLAPLACISFLIWPVVWPFGLVSRLVASWLNVADRPYWTAHELAEVVLRTHSEAVGDRGEDLLDSIIEFSDTVIREIMVPRTDMVVLNVASGDEDLYRILCGGHSRIPVYDETIDNIIGLLHVKDFFRSSVALNDHGTQKKVMEEESSKSYFQIPGVRMTDLIRPAFYVPELMKISELLREFQRRKTHMAIVVDEYGGTAGVVTLEDILEEIVGEIQDEYDIEERQYRIVGQNKILADGRVPLQDLEEVLEMEFPHDNGFETLAGFLLSLAGYLPEAGTVLEWQNLKFTVKDANEKRIAMVEVEHPTFTFSTTASSLKS